MGNEYLIYVNEVGKGSDNMFVYEFYFANDELMEGFWMQDFDYRPSSVCLLGTPNRESYDTLKILKTHIKFDLAKNSGCYSYLDCMSKIISICYENIDNYEEYPLDGRIVFQYGIEKDEVETVIARRDLVFED